MILDQKKEVVETIKQVAIFGSYRENIYLDTKYIAGLVQEKDPVRRAAWEKGSWDIPAGGMFDDLFRKENHVVPRFVIPKSWSVDRSYDWGSTHPAAAIWFALSDGTNAIMPDGRTFCPRAGSLIQLTELYFTAEIGTNKGLRMGSRAQAAKIKQVDNYLIESGWVQSPIWPGPADNQIGNVSNDSDSETIEIKMAQPKAYALGRKR